MNAPARAPSRSARGVGVLTAVAALRRVRAHR